MTTGIATGIAPWQIDPSHSNVEFGVRHLMIASVKGRFADVEGTVQIDEEHPARSVADVKIRAASIDTRNEQRDNHLRSADFFETEKYPDITFRSTTIVPTGENAYDVTGNLTMHGVTKPVVLTATEEGRARDPWGSDRVAFSATAKVNRKDFGLHWNQALETGGVMVGDEIKITLDVELVRKPE